jgi:polyisoprenoid-binding protein YceI
MKPGTVVAGGEAVLTLKRSDYGMDKMIGPVGDDVQITLDVEADKQ